MITGERANELLRVERAARQAESAFRRYWNSDKGGEEAMGEAWDRLVARMTELRKALGR